MSIDVYESAVQAGGTFGAVFERDDQTAYFYLLDLRREPGQQIVLAYNARGITELPATIAVTIAWASPGDLVGLFVEDALFAVFDLTDGLVGRPPAPGEALRFSNTKR